MTTCECCDSTPEYYIHYVIKHGSFEGGEKRFVKLSCAAHLTEVIASAANMQGKPAVIVESIAGREEWKTRVFAQHYGGKPSSLKQLVVEDINPDPETIKPVLIVRSKWGRMFHLHTGLQLRWCKERGPDGRSTGKPSKHRFEFGQFLLSFNKNRDRMETYAREITVEQSLELQQLDAEAEVCYKHTNMLCKKRNDLLATCFETGRPVQMNEILTLLKGEMDGRDNHQGTGDSGDQ